ncbi:UDP-N-acetylmuramate dehydrogenase [uncultured Pseudodesulfovibrio sp.]|uniref:UDP-N-acetylmuramate dehydrogenase n=1 Tax=uncultured Pseudodesulfovibrio sp. TaxID=2035858 RepID=UPI0029C7AF5D|nr:UDP-N-acetylmuramate dehydrogenase [uncultured Pseudodesulfovibrio sp.]
MTLELRKNPSLAEMTTLRLGGTAEVEVVVREEHDLDELAEFLVHETLRPFVIGCGSNLLAPDTHLDMALLRMAAVSGPDRVEKRGDKMIVRANAAQRLPGLLGWAQKAGFSGMENLTGIPGSVGGAVAMNAGSYGTEFGELLTRVRLWSPMQGLEWVDASECSFGYRSFSCGSRSGKTIVWEVELALDESSPKAVRKAMQATYKKKQSTQPVTAKSAGCVFKNPESKSAGMLLDSAGLKGVRIGGMAFSDIHANFLVNLGGGTSDEAMELLQLGRDKVKEQFGVTLETEVIVL